MHIKPNTTKVIFNICEDMHINSWFCINLLVSTKAKKPCHVAHKTWSFNFLDNMRVLPSGLICGSNRSHVTAVKSPGFRLQIPTPSAAPAAIAAPRAVVSGIDGFTEVNERRPWWFLTKVFLMTSEQDLYMYPETSIFYNCIMLPLSLPTAKLLLWPFILLWG